MDVTGDPISLLLVFEATKAPLEQLGDSISDRHLLLLYLAAPSEKYSVEITQIEASLGLNHSMVERLIDARHRKMSERGDIGLAARRHDPRGRDRVGARSKGLRPTKSPSQGRSRGSKPTKSQDQRSDYSKILRKEQKPGRCHDSNWRKRDPLEEKRPARDMLGARIYASLTTSATGDYLLQVRAQGHIKAECRSRHRSNSRGEEIPRRCHRGLLATAGWHEANGH